MTQSKYQWHQWFSRRRTVLVRGVDYNCSQSTMAQMVRNRASQRRVRVEVTDTGDTIIMEVTGEIPCPYPAPVTSQPDAPTLAQAD